MQSGKLTTGAGRLLSSVLVLAAVAMPAMAQEGDAGETPGMSLGIGGTGRLQRSIPSRSSSGNHPPRGRTSSPSERRRQ